MQDHPPQNRTLSEISHLFLSSVRDRQTEGVPRPRRTPPKSDVSIDLTPEEFAGMRAAADGGRRIAPVRAVISAHLNGRQFDRVKEYARHLAGQTGRVGLIELDASEFRLMSFDRAETADVPDAPSAECFEPRQMAEAIEEMNCDVDQWLLLVPSPRTPEARALLAAVDHWVMLSTCDHDGVVACYRTLKGLVDAHRPRLSLALLDVADASESDRVFRKLSGVCQQFLDWPLELETAVSPANEVSEHLVQYCRPAHDKTVPAGPQWTIVADFLAGAAAQPVKSPGQDSDSASESPRATSEAEHRRLVADVVIPSSPASPAQPLPEPVMMKVVPASDPVIPVPPSPATPASITDVIDLPGQTASPDAILAAVLHQRDAAMVECPLRAPMCPHARLAVGRDRNIVLLAVARQGLAELRAIGQAYRWLKENRALIGMAVPQLAIDTAQMPRLCLLVDQADVSAEILQPMLQSGNVTVQAYRTLRWGEKMGLFLEAA